jgi:RNA polymerase sigma-70 factor (sigma-E family)
VADRDREFGEYFDARVAVLRRTAYLLCGDWHRAEDLTQLAFTKLYVAWPRLQHSGAVDAYARQILVRAAIDDSRRWFRRRETVAEVVPELAAADRSVEDEVDVRRALAALPPGQRAAVVLRYWEDLPVSETAHLLGCSEGTVKSQAAKGLAALRRLLAAGRPVLEDLQ